MIRRYPLMNEYWQDKVAAVEDIEVPAYVVGSYTNPVHVVGTLDGYRALTSEKWLRLHNSQEWPDYYHPENKEDLRRFFDRYLKDIENGWEKTPRVRLTVLDPGGTDVANRPEESFPPQGVSYRKLFPRRRLPGPCLTNSRHRMRRPGTGPMTGRGRAVFDFKFDRTTDLIGDLKLPLWVEASGADDMDIFAQVQKLDSRGRTLSTFIIPPPNPAAGVVIKVLKALGKLDGPMLYSGPSGRLRASLRQLDPDRSTPVRPFPYLYRKATVGTGPNSAGGNFPAAPGAALPCRADIAADRLGLRPERTHAARTAQTRNQ